jgi:O-antigen/teichoic acid export membrane protein
MGPIFKKIFYYIEREKYFYSLLKNSFLIFTGNTLGAIISTTSFVLIARALGVSQLGLFTLIISAIQLMNRFFNCQSWQGFIKYGIEYFDNKEIKQFVGLLQFILFVDLVTAAMAFALIFNIGFHISAILKTSQNIQVPIQIYAFSVFFRIDSIPIGILRIYKKFKELSYYQVLIHVTKLVLIIVVLAISKRLLLFVWAYLISDVLTGIGIWIYSIIVLNRDHAVKSLFSINVLSKKVYLKILKFLFVTNINGSVKLVYRELDLFIVKLFCNESVVGILKVAKQFSMPIQMITGSINQVLYPDLVSLYHKDKRKEISSLIIKISIPLTVLGSGILLIFGLFGKEIIRMLLGSEYMQGVWVVFLFLLAESLAMIFGWMPQLILATGRPQNTLVAIFAASCVYFLIIFKLAPKFGALGAAQAFLVSIIVILSIMGLLLKRSFSWGYLYKVE